MAKIMVVDDAAFMRMRCKKLLTQLGHEVTEAATGSQAVEAYKNNRPDMVLGIIKGPAAGENASIMRQRTPNWPERHRSILKRTRSWAGA